MPGLHGHRWFGTDRSARRSPVQMSEEQAPIALPLLITHGVGSSVDTVALRLQFAKNLGVFVQLLSMQTEIRC